MAEKEYIEREPIIQFIEHGLNEKNFGYDAIEILGEIQFAPAADVAPVKHGYWSHLGGDEFCCTNCGHIVTTDGSWEHPWQNFCPNCGARMDGEIIND